MRTLQLLLVGLCVAVCTPVWAGDAQFVEADDWFFLPYPENSESAHGQIKLGTMKDEPPEFKGTKVFWVGAENRKWPARTYFQTRMAKPQELLLGRRVVYPLGEIKSAKDKAEMGWGYRRIINLVDAPKGHVIVDGSSNPEVELASLRVIVGGEPDPTITMSGKQDAHGFHPEHWLVFAEDRQPDADGVETKMALAIRPPPKPGEAGTFLMLDSGQILTTKHAWRSRPATRAELKTGTRVAIFFASGIDPPSRDLAYRETWWIGPLTSVTPAVIKVGKSSVRVESMRIVE